MVDPIPTVGRGRDGRGRAAGVVGVLTRFRVGWAANEFGTTDRAAGAAVCGVINGLPGES